ncbi:uncharacterized protein ASCRUDRAFT_81004 [Ascoidea rubescens DSM 1968]|uniref:Uncharacterized protein n=1 Tax=Ascoidea rubescens DSM 1968 TaxID=1344418 RepID=A0A1D2VI19_9ASCO|nr:hypothetical protein ASCRUDRAFT_81004 [Ascoidea rubescens DSM 1968]ODV61288.1 hypothetical protein ASCRUDRAFT_81004 [Ascoidea rubescens DSM 1968]
MNNNNQNVIQNKTSNLFAGYLLNQDLQQKLQQQQFFPHNYQTQQQLKAIQFQQYQQVQKLHQKQHSNQIQKLQQQQQQNPLPLLGNANQFTQNFNNINPFANNSNANINLVSNSISSHTPIQKSPIHQTSSFSPINNNSDTSTQQNLKFQNTQLKIQRNFSSSSINVNTGTVSSDNNTNNTNNTNNINNVNKPDQINNNTNTNTNTSTSNTSNSNGNTSNSNGNTSNDTSNKPDNFNPIKHAIESLKNTVNFPLLLSESINNRTIQIQNFFKENCSNNDKILQFNQFLELLNLYYIVDIHKRQNTIDYLNLQIKNLNDSIEQKDKLINESFQSINLNLSDNFQKLNTLLTDNLKDFNSKISDNQIIQEHVNLDLDNANNTNPNISDNVKLKTDIHSQTKDITMTINLNIKQPNSNQLQTSDPQDQIGNIAQIDNIAQNDKQNDKQDDKKNDIVLKIIEISSQIDKDQIHSFGIKKATLNIKKENDYSAHIDKSNTLDNTISRKEAVSSYNAGSKDKPIQLGESSETEVIATQEAQTTQTTQANQPDEEHPPVMNQQLVESVESAKYSDYYFEMIYKHIKDTRDEVKLLQQTTDIFLNIMVDYAPNHFILQRKVWREYRVFLSNLNDIIKLQEVKNETAKKSPLVITKIKPSNLIQRLLQHYNNTSTSKYISPSTGTERGIITNVAFKKRLPLDYFKVSISMF